MAEQHSDSETFVNKHLHIILRLLSLEMEEIAVVFSVVYGSQLRHTNVFSASTSATELHF